jgi:hypothetical protein
VHAKAPSCHLSCKSSTALKLFKQLTALLQTINCRKAWGKLPTGTEQGSPHCSVWNSHKCPANTATKSDKYKRETKYGYMQRRLPTAYPVKAAPPLSSSNNWLHSCRLSIAEKHGANNQQEQSKAPPLFSMKFTQLPSQYSSSQLRPICRTNNVAQQFSCLTLDNVTERWRKVVLDNLWRSHIDQHWLASIWSVGSRWLSPKLPLAIWQSIDIYKLYVREEKWI